MTDKPVYDCIMQRRSIRRFQQTKIQLEVLNRLLNAARVAPSAANKQPLEYIIITNRDLREKVFQTLKWAAYIAPEGTPQEEEKPAAYIIVLVNNYHKGPDFARDAGAAIENILLAATEEGLGTCWLRSIDFDRIVKIFDMPDHIEVDSVIALGYPAESPKIVDLTESVRYFRENGVHLVPKRLLENIMHVDGYSI
ncbi:MAG: nitroreductase family protein [Pseudomonadota bacterium]